MADRASRLKSAMKLTAQEQQLEGWKSHMIAKGNRYCVCLPYIGNELSINHCYYNKTKRYRSITVKWMARLSRECTRVPAAERDVKLRVYLSGTFKDRVSMPDLHNLHKIIGDAIAMGLGLTTDKDMMMTDVGHKVSKTIEPNIMLELEFEPDRKD